MSPEQCQRWQALTRHTLTAYVQLQEREAPHSGGSSTLHRTVCEDGTYLLSYVNQSQENSELTLKSRLGPLRQPRASREGPGERRGGSQHHLEGEMASD